MTRDLIGPVYVAPIVDALVKACDAGCNTGAATVCLDSLANELKRLRELEVKWHRALAERRLVGDLMLAANGAANFLDGVRYGECYSRPLRGTVAVLQDIGPMERPLTEADLERFRELVQP